MALRKGACPCEHAHGSRTSIGAVRLSHRRCCACTFMRARGTASAAVACGFLAHAPTVVVLLALSLMQVSVREAVSALASPPSATPPPTAPPLMLPAQLTDCDGTAVDLMVGRARALLMM